MGNCLHTLAFTAYTPSLPSGASEATGRPVTNLTLYDRPLRTWRSQDLTSEKVVCDLGSAKTVSHLAVLNGNFTTALIEGATDSGFTSGVVTLGTFALTRDVRTGRYGQWCVVASPQSRRYLRVTPSNVLGGATYFELGTLGLFEAANVVEWADSPAWPFRYVRQQAHTRVEFAGGGQDVARDGEAFVEIGVSSSVWRRGGAVLGQLQALIQLGPQTPFVFHENRGDLSQVYAMRLQDAVTFSERFVTFETELRMRECL